MRHLTDYPPPSQVVYFVLTETRLIQYLSLNKGTNGRWRDVLTDEDLELYAEVMSKGLPEDCANWLENGGQI